MIDHHIQKDIINQLTYHAQLRFSELRPDGMESNIFMYHLNQLIRGGYVAKTDGHYSLAHLGLQYVDGLSTVNLRPRKQPKLIAILVLQNHEGKWLLAERRIQPYIGERMFPSGKQHFGENFTEHAARELQEKIGLEAQLSYRGMAEIIIHKDGEVLTQVVAHVHYGRIASVDPPPATNRFGFVWHDFAHDTAPLMGGTRELYDVIKDSDEQFMLELSV